MHLSSGVIEWWDAEEYIVTSLTVVILLYFSGVHEALVIMKNKAMRMSTQST